MNRFVRGLALSMILAFLAAWSMTACSKEYDKATGKKESNDSESCIAGLALYSACLGQAGGSSYATQCGGHYLLVAGLCSGGSGGGGGGGGY